MGLAGVSNGDEALPNRRWTRVPVERPRIWKPTLLARRKRHVQHESKPMPRNCETLELQV